MSIVYHGTPNNIRDTIPLDNSSNTSVLALPYITWGLICDHKLKRRSQLLFLHWTVIQDLKIESRIPKIGKKDSQSLPRAKTGY